MQFPVMGSQLSIVHATASSQFFGVKTQPESGSQLSIVHGSSSLQSPLSGVWMQFPVMGSQLSIVHATASSQFFGVKTQPESGSQVSMVQGSLSLQSPLSGVWMQFPVMGSQLSIVQAIPSSQFFGVKTHPESGSQLSIVHGSLSSHTIGVWTQSPTSGSQ
ncbi:MAG: hypothetical protein BWX80_04139 [Candidatus Hydrogenedentes bacterium ADurb.Bin101]|nr:MAG: hypothetical protein BWX80_04139 [Candidatus Hydrogenedentes bacterium ADurb.Bin101]